jgi:hypothetical protein
MQRGYRSRRSVLLIVVAFGAAGCGGDDTGGEDAADIDTGVAIDADPAAPDADPVAPDAADFDAAGDDVVCDDDTCADYGAVGFSTAIVTNDCPTGVKAQPYVRCARPGDWE